MRRTLLALLIAAPAAAHRGSLTYGDVRLAQDTVRYALDVGRADLYDPLGMPQDVEPTREQALAGADAIARFVARHLSVTNNGHACEPESEGVALVDKADGFAARVRLAYRCARRLERVAIAYQMFFSEDLRHQSFTRIEIDGKLREHVFTATRRSLDLARVVTVWDHVRDYLVLGVEHIFTGYDHICFLIGLLLVAGIDGRSGEPRGLRRGLLYTVTIVTAFTVAHSVTLIVAALGWVALPGRLVESAIALSIAYVGAENVAVREPRFRWALTFAFGLIHGFGFAGVLREIGLPDRGLVLSLLSFNLGVELGQFAIVALVFPLLHLAARAGGRSWYRPAIRVAGSAALIAFGALWFVQRAFAIELLGGALG